MVSILLGCDIISLGEWCPVFQDNVVVINFKGQNVYGHDPRAGLHIVENRKQSCHYQEIEPQLFGQPASWPHYPLQYVGITFV